MNFFYLLAQTTVDVVPPEPGPEPSPDSPFGLVFFLALIIMTIAFYILIQRPQKLKEEQKAKALESLKKGDTVVSIGGIHGTVARFNKEKGTIFINVGKGVELEFTRAAINPWENPNKSDSKKGGKEKEESVPEGSPDGDDSPSNSERGESPQKAASGGKNNKAVKKG